MTTPKSLEFLETTPRQHSRPRSAARAANRLGTAEFRLFHASVEKPVEIYL